MSATLYTVVVAGGQATVARSEDHQIRGDEHPSDVAVYIDVLRAPSREQALALFAQAKAAILEDLK